MRTGREGGGGWMMMTSISNWQSVAKRPARGAWRVNAAPRQGPPPLNRCRDPQPPRAATVNHLVPTPPPHPPTLSHLIPSIQATLSSPPPSLLLPLPTLLPPSLPLPHSRTTFFAPENRKLSRADICRGRADGGLQCGGRCGLRRAVRVAVGGAGCGGRCGCGGRRLDSDGEGFLQPADCAAASAHDATGLKDGGREMGGR